MVCYSCVIKDWAPSPPSEKIPKRNCSNFRHLVVHAIIFKMAYELMYSIISVHGYFYFQMVSIRNSTLNS